jgi:two-component system, response regulator
MPRYLDGELMRVLVVEDSPDDVAMILRVLQRHAHAVACDVVGDGAAALDYLLCRGSYAAHTFGRPPCFVLLDLGLPGVGGIEVLCQARAAPHLRTVPFIVLSGSDEDEDRVRSYCHGVNSFVRKSHDAEAFEASVDAVATYWLETNCGD